MSMSCCWNHACDVPALTNVPSASRIPVTRFILSTSADCVESYPLFPFSGLLRTAGDYGVRALTNCPLCPTRLVSQNGRMPFVPTMLVESGIQFMRLVETSTTSV